MKDLRTGNNFDREELLLIEKFRRARRDSSLVVLEGFHALKHAIRFQANISGAFAFNVKELISFARDLAPDTIGWLDEFVTEIPAQVFACLAEVPPDTGVISIAERRRTDVARILVDDKSLQPIIILENPTHLGNVGAVIRVAAAAGAEAVLTTGLQDPWAAGALRGSAGLHYAISVESVSDIPPTNRPIIALHPEGAALRPDIIPDNAVLIFGSERHGLTQQWLNKATQAVKIPMRNGVSSLNLATAVAITLYTWKLNRTDTNLARHF
jgi:RNA methyltransferase, TrmH family